MNFISERKSLISECTLGNINLLSNNTKSVLTNKALTTPLNVTSCSKLPFLIKNTQKNYVCVFIISIIKSVQIILKHFFQWIIKGQMR